MKKQDILEILDKTGTKEWNESIAIRLESVASFLRQDEWTKGVSPYIMSIIGNTFLKWVNGKPGTEDSNYLRGVIAGLNLVNSLPATVEFAIKQKENAQESSPKGVTGYEG